MKIIILFFIMIFYYSTAERSEVPVLITDDGQVLTEYRIQSNPFEKMTSSYFADLAIEARKMSSVVLIFVEDKLCIEDITTRDGFGTPFTYLQTHLKKQNLIYIPAVTTPVTTLTQVFPPLQANVIYTSSAANLELDKTLKYMYIRFVDESTANKTRVGWLRDHDELIREINLRIKQQRGGLPTVIFYTGKKNPITFEKLRYRYSRRNENDDNRVIETREALFRLAGIYSVSAFRKARFPQKPFVTHESRDDKKLTVSLSYSDFSLQFNFTFTKTDWLLVGIALIEGGEEVGSTTMGVGAPWNNSYVCAEPIILMNSRDSSSVTISRYQIEPAYRNPVNETRYHEKLERIRRTTGRVDVRDGGGDTSTTESTESGDNNDASSFTATAASGNYSEGKKFGDKVNCGPYFSCVILSSLFIVGMLLGILFVGIILLMNCHSNSKFDNPQGKELFTKLDKA